MTTMPQILKTDYQHFPLLDSNKSLLQLHTQKDLVSRQYAPSFLSSLAKTLNDIFIYPKLTGSEILDTIGYLLYEYDESVHIQLFQCLIHHKLLNQVENGFYSNMNKSSQVVNLSGIFMPLTKCYSPSCQPSQDIACYSLFCPNKNKPSRLSIANHISLQEQNFYQENWVVNHFTNTLQTRQKLLADWVESIPRHLRENTNRKELKRQAAIAELLLTEQNYANDLIILRQVYADPLLQSSEIIADLSRRRRFYENVFGNYLEIACFHHLFHEKLVSRQQCNFFAGRVGTLVMEHVTNLIEPYIQYASNHLKAIHCMTIEKRHNPLFNRFLDQQNAQKCTRRLGLQHYLTSPTLWIGKFKLMIEAILKHTNDDADQLSLQASIAVLHDILCQMNTSASQVLPHDLRMEELFISIYVSSSQNSNELQLLSIPYQTELLGEKTLWLARATHPLLPSLCHIFLFSHALVLTHPRVLQDRTEYIVIPGSPIPLPFLALDLNGTSMMRRLSFASTSMVSTPLHLITSLRRQKSACTETAVKPVQDILMSRKSPNCHYHKKRKPRNEKSSDTPSLFSQESQQEQNQTVKKGRLFRIKTKFFRFKSRWSAGSLSAPVSPVSPPDINDSQLFSKTCRRDSAPTLLCSNNECKKRLSSTESIPNHISQQQQRRTLKVSHLACPYTSFRLEFVTRQDRLFWENLLRMAITRKSEENAIFKRKLICKSLVFSSSQPPSSTLTSSILSDDEDSDNYSCNMIEKIRCLYTFVYKSQDQFIEKEMIAIGTHQGIWIGLYGKVDSFQCVLTGHAIQQIVVFENKLIALAQTSKGSILVAHSLASLLRPAQENDTEDLKTKETFEKGIFRTFNVLCFSVGKIRGQSVILCLMRRCQSIWLVVCSLNVKVDCANSQALAECKVTIRDPTELQIIEDSIFVRSEKYGIEQIDVSQEAALVLVPNKTWLFIGASMAFMPLTHPLHHAAVCDGQFVHTVSLFEQKSAVKDFAAKIKFESQVSQMTRINRYLIAFSPTIIEIRDIETCELIQVIKGTHIKLISSANCDNQPVLFTMSNSKNAHITSMFQLMF